MVETLLAWILLVSGVIHGEVLYYVAAGCFAVACQISRVVDKMGGN